ncbi:hypothetical protein FLJC2902T_30390 [Flavobacterium limnosediminis JC2902]|uniref:Uncharacterized protein n=1 Tax=Flavobacterium limnosediminis JC2902 TaxID=1341181 RepID=V6SN55_9FLAO|nr:hypothetical protein FLJC2902T_30390 [Flavobacterium limnosediminis JC2902]
MVITCNFIPLLYGFSTNLSEKNKEARDKRKTITLEKNRI